MFSYVQQPSFYDNPPNWPFTNVGGPGSNPAANSSPTQTNASVRFNQVSPLMPYSTAPGSQAASQFDLTGLPFSGLDFLHNFTPAATPGADSGGVDPFWTTLGGGAFKFGPDLPFTLSDAQGEGGGDR